MDNWTSSFIFLKLKTKVAHSVDTPGRGFDLQGRLQQVASRLAILCHNYHQQQLILLSLKKRKQHNLQPLSILVFLKKIFVNDWNAGKVWFAASLARLQ